MHTGVEKLAQLITSYCVEVGKGDKVLIDGDPTAASLLHIYLHEEILKAGGVPFHKLTLGDCDFLNMVYADTSQYEAFVQDDLRILDNADVFIGIEGSVNPRRLDRVLEKVEVEKILRLNRISRVVRAETYKRYEAGDLRVCYVEYPTDGTAQQLGCSLFEYEKKIVQACFLDTENPTETWRALAERQEGVVAALAGRRKFSVRGKNVNLTFEVNGEWISGNGRKYLPDGEVYTDAVVQDSVNGKIAFSYPGTFEKKEIPDLELRFDGGRVVEASASAQREFVEKYFFEDRDGEKEEPLFMGAFGVGTNYRMGQFVGCANLDEKRGGTIHIAFRSPMWVLTTDMEEDAVIKADGDVVYEGRRFSV